MKGNYSSFAQMEGIKPLAGVTIKSVHLDNIMMTWMEFQPGSLLPDHSHPHEQISLVIEGRLELDIDGEKRLMARGDVAVVPSGIRHSARVMDEYTIAVDSWHPVRDDYKMQSP